MIPIAGKQGKFAVKCKEKRKQIMFKSNFTLNGKLKKAMYLHLPQHYTYEVRASSSR
jgi:hypothetical protein